MTYPGIRRCSRRMASLATAVLVASLAWPGPARAQRRASAPGSTILVNADEELAGYLRKAKEAIEEKNYETAIDILHALITRTKAGFAPTDEKGRFVALRLRAAEMIRTMPDEGLSLYRSIYDPQARRLFQEARRSGQLAPMRLIVSRYANTSVGPLAQETLASLYHDRGRFSQAAHAFGTAAELYGDDPRAEVLRGRAAIAYHLAGDRGRGKSLLDALSEGPGGRQEVRWGGRPVRLDRIVADVLSREVRQEHVAIARDGWPGLTAFPGGMARMQPSDVVLMPRWTRPAQAGRSGEEATLVAMSALFNDYMRMRHRSRGRIGRLYHKGGAVMTSIRNTSRGRQGGNSASPLPGVIHPLVVGDLVIYRTDEAVVAVDRSTGYTWEAGKSGWKSFDLPMTRTVTVPAGHSSSSSVCIRDLGRHRLSLGAGKVYTLFGFRPPVGRYYVRRTRQRRPEPDSSGLAALSLGSQGKIVWRVGNGAGKGSDFLASCKFLSAPTYRDGRLYVVAEQTHEYHLVCLDAETGEHLWHSSINQAPTLQNIYGSFRESVLSVGSPPSVVDGRVYALSNAGAVAAFDAETGQSLWAYQYDSSLNTGSRGVSVTSGVVRGANPLIVARGMVICAPADSPKVMAFRTSDGHRVWTQQIDLITLRGIDADRFLVAGPGLEVRRTRSGSRIAFASGVDDVHGEPAVTPGAIIASGVGRIHEMDLENYKVTQAGQVAEGGLLGNLVSAGGVLVAANPSGVCTYFGYEVARELITEQLADATGADRLELLDRRARLALNAKRLEAALEDFLACRDLAGELGDAARRQELRIKVYLLYVALGNRADKGERMVELFTEAQKLAQTEQEKAHMGLRIAYALEFDPPRAVEAAQELIAAHGEEKIVDVTIGPQAGSVSYLDRQRQGARQAKLLAEEYIDRLIKAHGREVYAAFDRQAEQRVSQLLRDGDERLGAKLREVAERWPNSVHADRALYRAAEAYYRASRAPDAADSESQMDSAKQLLRRLGNSKGAFRVPASAALALIYARNEQWLAAGLTVAPLKDAPPRTPVEFAEIDTTLGDILERIERKDLTGQGVPDRPAARLAEEGEIEPSGQLAEASSVFVRRDALTPLFLGDWPLAMRGGRLVAYAPPDGGEPDPRWLGLTEADPAALGARRSKSPPSGLIVGGFSPDGGTLGMTDMSTVVGFDVETARRAWSPVRLGDSGVEGLYGASGAGRIAVVGKKGKLIAVEIATGKVAWEAMLVGGNRAPSAPPLVAGGHLLVSHDTSNRLACFDLETGRLVHRVAGKGDVFYGVSPGGLLLTVVDGAVVARDLAHPQDVLWRRDYARAGQVAVLATGTDRAVLSRTEPPSVEVVGLADGRTRLTLSMRGSSGKVAYPVQAALDGEDLFVVGSNGASTPGVHGGLGALATWLSVRKFELTRGDGEAVWSVELGKVNSPRDRVFAPVVGRNHVVVGACPAGSEGPGSRWWLIRRRDGLARWTVQSADSATASVCAPPVVADGYLCLENSKGLAWYRAGGGSASR